MRDLLKKHFGYERFRPLQEEIIEHCVSGKDSLVLMPTGGGKSLCFQLPALKFHGLTVVISPLIALMKDQVDALRANGVAAAFMNSSLSPSDLARTEHLLKREELKLLYLAPERLAMPSVRELLQTLRISLFAIDEAHCISEWGHDFRPDYRGLRAIRQLFPGVPVMALTATANARVRDDIIAQLGLKRGRVFQSSFNRPNLTYRVLPKKRASDRLAQEVRNRPNQSIIVYCFSRKGAEKVAADLRANGIGAAAYHAGLSNEERSRAQNDFIRDRVPVIAATIAFGMGIDKPDVRLVVHMDMPKSVEGYYQETGRSGRDGLPSDCLLFYSNGDRFKHELFIREMSDPNERDRARLQLRNIAEYCEQSGCRRAFLLSYFGETPSRVNCGACDACLPPETFVFTAPQPTGVAEFDQELFEKLRQSRRELADAHGVPPYIIFGDRTLQDMARKFPRRMESMATIFGVGREKLAQYGERFLHVVQTYATEKGIEERGIEFPITPEQSPARRALSETAMTSVKLFAQNMKIERIARARELAVSTILGHLEQALDNGVALDVSRLEFSSAERFDRIAEAFERTGTDMLAPVRARLGDSYGYEEIRYARFLIRARKK